MISGLPLATFDLPLAASRPCPRLVIASFSVTSLSGKHVFHFRRTFLFVLPAISVLVEALLRAGSADLPLLVGKWFVFWGVGVRLSSPATAKSPSRDLPARVFFRSKIAARSPLSVRLASPILRWERWAY